MTISWTLNDSDFAEIWEQAAPYTMTSPERGYALYQAVRHIVAQTIPGCLVECGTWKGGSAMIMALTLKQLGAANRPIILFDTFDGMTEASDLDLDRNGRPADVLMAGEFGAATAELVTARAGLDEVRAALDSTGYDPRRIRYVEGDIRQTAELTQTSRIALLRLDTDFYDSTLAELTQFYPRVSHGGIVIIDDYGHWQGCKQAVDDYFSSDETAPSPFLMPIDYTGRMFVKQDERVRADIERYDHVPDGFSDPQLLSHFPSAEVHNPHKVRWPHLRRQVPHIFRTDNRNPKRIPIGLVSYEEATCLHNFSRQFAGKRALEIGCHFGWSSAHILAAGVHLDIVDPALEDETRYQQVTGNLQTIPTDGSFKLWPGYSPGILPEVAADRDEPFSFVFIDGNHDGEAPALDAREVISHCAETALVMLHDLASGDVAAGLDVFRDAGWNTRVLNTMQIMGVAWRGEITPPEYHSDPNTPWPMFRHLSGYEIY